MGGGLVPGLTLLLLYNTGRLTERLNWACYVGVTAQGAGAPEDRKGAGGGKGVNPGGGGTFKKKTPSSHNTHDAQPTRP